MYTTIGVVNKKNKNSKLNCYETQSSVIISQFYCVTS